MRGRKPKPPEMRQRRNKTATHAMLTDDRRKAKVPALPKRARGQGAWHPEVRAWWNEVWRSPMSQQYLEVERLALGRVAQLWQLYHMAVDAGETHHGERVSTLYTVAAKAEERFGLDPQSRNRLQWQIERVNRDEKKPPRAPERPKRATDPRKVLRAVK